MKIMSSSSGLWLPYLLSILDTKLVIIQILGKQVSPINQSSNTEGLLGTLFPSANLISCRKPANFLWPKAHDYFRAQRVLGSSSPKGHADPSLSKSYILKQQFFNLLLIFVLAHTLPHVFCLSTQKTSIHLINLLQKRIFNH